MPGETVLQLLLDARRAEKQGPAAVERRRRARLTEMVAFARANSPYYHDLYRDLPERIEDPGRLPVTGKKQLMARFDDWITDREVTLAKVQTFVDNLDLIGEPFLGKYLVAKTAGTTGTPGVFLLDKRTWAVTAAFGLRELGTWLSVDEVIRVLARGRRTAVVSATGGHFMSAVTTAATRRTRLGKTVRLFAAQTPLPELVAQLNQFRPVILAGYASMLALLAREQEVGRLRLSPVLVLPGAEGLPLGEYERIARIFRAKVRDTYGATECPFMTVACEQGWLHVNNGWAVLEPVDADYRPVPPGQESHTVLVSNLANRVQPILRYDLGDNILQRPDRCPCGNPFPAIRVAGRTFDLLTLSNDRGQPVAIPSIVLNNVVVRVPGSELCQIVQTSPTTLRVRLRARANADQDRVWVGVRAELAQFLTELEVHPITVERAEEPPEHSPDRKYRTVIPLR